MEVMRLQKILVRSKAAKLKAIRKVTQDNVGKKTSGIDGIKSIPPEQRLNLLTDLRLDGNAAPIKRVYIPKGKNEKRPLGIPIIQDRIKQALVKLVLEPEWEAKFEPNSYGFRPGRSCHDAVEAIFIAINQKPKYVLDADIKGCFDNIDHQFLLTKLNTFPEMEMQIKSWLKAGVMKDILLTTSKRGVPQGGTLSPLLMNIVLHGLETEIIDFMRNLKLIDENKRSLIKRRRPSSINTIVYADDFVVLNENLQVIEQTKEFIKEFLWKRGLKLNENKTRICHTLHGNFPGFDFLGFNIRQYEIGKYRVRKTKAALNFRTLIRPSKDKIKKHYENVKSIIDRTRNTEVLLMELNPKIIGWARYYRTVVSYRTFKWLNTLMFHALLKWQYKKHSKRSRKWLNKVYYHKKGDRNWVFGIKLKRNNEVISLKQYTDVPIERFVKVRDTKSPYDGDFLYWALRLNNHPVISGNVVKMLKKQKGRCNMCKLPFFPTDLVERDHIIPLSKGGTHKMNNFQLLHSHCHKNKTAIEKKK